MSNPGRCDETWADIPGYEGRYCVSNFGRVRSRPRWIESVNAYGAYRKLLPDRLKKQRADRDGYLRTGLRGDDGKDTFYAVHRAVALAFLGEPMGEKTQVNHVDGNKRNNHAGNLEWCSASDNQRHAYQNGIHALNKHRCPITGRMSPNGSGRTRGARCAEQQN